MGEVKPLRVDCINPTIVLESLARELPTLNELFVVGINKDKEPVVWATGDLSNLAYAALVLTNTAHRYLNGEIDDE